MSSRSSRQSTHQDQSISLPTASIAAPPPGQNKFQYSSAIYNTPTQKNTPSSPIRPTWATLPPSPPSSPCRVPSIPPIPLTQTPQSSIKVKSAPTGRAKTTATASTVKKQASIPLSPAPKPATIKTKPKFTPLQPKSKENAVTTANPKEKPISQLIGDIPNVDSSSPYKRKAKRSKTSTKPMERPPPVLDEPDDMEWDDRLFTFKKTPAALEREEKEKQRVRDEELRKQKARVEDETREGEEAAKKAMKKEEIMRIHNERLREMKQKRERETLEANSKDEGVNVDRVEVMRLHEKQLKEMRVRKQSEILEREGKSEGQPSSHQSRRGLGDRSTSAKRERVDTQEAMHQRETTESSVSAPLDGRKVPTTLDPPRRDSSSVGKKRQSLIQTEAHMGLYNGDEVDNPTKQAHQSSCTKVTVEPSLPDGEEDEVSDTELSDIEDPIDRSRTRRSTSRKDVYQVKLPDDRMEMPTSAQPIRRQLTIPTSNIRTVNDPFSYLKEGQLDPDFVFGTPQLSPKARVTQTQSAPPDSFQVPIVLEERKGKSENRGRSRMMATYSKRLPEIYLKPTVERHKFKLSPEPDFQGEYDGAKRERSTSHWPEKGGHLESRQTGSDMEYEDEEQDLDRAETYIRSKTARARGRNGSWPTALLDLFRNPSSDEYQQKHHIPSLRPVSERFHAKHSEEIDDLPRVGGNDDAPRAPKRKRRRVVNNHPADDIRRMPRPQLRLTKRSRADKQIQGYVQQVNRHRRNDVITPRAHRPTKPRPQIIAENVPEHVLKPIERINFKDIKASYAINRQKELEEERRAGAGFRVARHPVNEYLIKAVEKGMRKEELGYGVRHRARKTGRAKAQNVPLERNLGWDWDDTPGEVIGEWTPSLATGSGRHAQGSRERAPPMAGRIPPLRFTATEEVDEDDEREKEKSRPETRRDTIASDRARYPPLNFTDTTTSNTESNVQSASQSKQQEPQLASSEEMLGPNRPRQRAERENVLDGLGEGELTGGHGPHSNASQAQAEEALRAMEKEEQMQTDRYQTDDPPASEQRNDQILDDRASQRGSRSKTPVSGAVSLTQISRLIDEIDQMHPDLMSKSPSTSVRADTSKAALDVSTKDKAMGALTADEQGLEDRAEISPPTNDSDALLPAQQQISQAVDEIDSRTPSQDDHRPHDPYQITTSNIGHSHLGCIPKRLNGLEMTEQLLQLAKVLPEQPKASTSARSRRSKVQERAKRVQERRSRLPEPELAKQRKISEFTASPVRIGLSRDVSVGTKNTVNARVLKRKYAESSQAVLSQPYKAPRLTEPLDRSETGVGELSYEQGAVIIGEEEEEEPEDQENVPVRSAQLQNAVRQTSLLINPQYKTPTQSLAKCRITPASPFKPSRHSHSSRRIRQPPTQEEEPDDELEEELEDVVPSLPPVTAVTRTSKGSSSTGTSHSTTVRTPFTSPLKKVSSAPVSISTSRLRQRSLGVRPSSISGNVHAEYKEPYRSERAMLEAKGGKGKGKMKEVIQEVGEDDEYGDFDGDEQFLGSVDVDAYWRAI